MHDVYAERFILTASAPLMIRAGLATPQAAAIKFLKHN
jgi:hypothetical protein